MRAALSTRRVSCRSAFSRQRSQCACARHNEAVLRGNNVVKLVPAESVLQLTADDRFRLTAAQFEELSTAFFAEIAREFLSPPGRCASEGDTGGDRRDRPTVQVGGTARWTATGEKAVMSAKAGEKAQKTGDFSGASCDAKVHVPEGKKISKRPNGHKTYETRAQPARQLVATVAEVPSGLGR